MVPAGGSKAPTTIIGTLPGGAAVGSAVSLPSLARALEAIRKLVAIGALDGALVAGVGSLGGGSGIAVPELQRPTSLSVQVPGGSGAAGSGSPSTTGGGSPSTPPKYTINRHGQLTNGKYTIDAAGMAPHKTGSLAAGKSQWLSSIDAEKAVLDAAAKADESGLWVGNKAKVPADMNVGALGRTGKLTPWINVYRTKTGFVHGSPGSPP